MTAYFFDSSALVKRYIIETGSAWIRQITVPQTGNLIFVVRITWVEVRSTFARRQREGSLTLGTLTRLVQTLRSDFNTQYQVIELDSTIAETAGLLVSQHPLRAYDAVQLASLLRIQAAFAQTSSNQLVFLCADNRLLSVAAALGVAIDNPNNHP